MKTIKINKWRTLLACFVLVNLCPEQVISQEIIRFKNGDEYEAIIVRLTADTVVYKLVAEPLVTRTVLMDQVETISASHKVISTQQQLMRNNGYRAHPFSLPRPSTEVPLPPLEEAFLRLKKAKTMSLVGTILGSLNQVTLIVNKGYMTGDRAEEDYQPIFAVIGLSAGITRMALSPIPPFQLRKAEQAVKRLQSIPGNEGKFQESLKSIRTAKFLSAAVPVLGFTAATLMVAGYMQKTKLIFDEEQGYYVADERMNNLFIGAWATMGATLVTSIIATCYIGQANSILLNESGSLSIGMNQQGLGLNYHLGTK